MAKIIFTNRDFDYDLNAELGINLEQNIYQKECFITRWELFFSRQEVESITGLNESIIRRLNTKGLREIAGYGRCDALTLTYLIVFSILRKELGSQTVYEVMPKYEDFSLVAKTRGIKYILFLDIDRYLSKEQFILIKQLIRAVDDISKLESSNRVIYLSNNNFNYFDSRAVEAGAASVSAIASKRITGGCTIVNLETIVNFLNATSLSVKDAKKVIH